ncbi:MAG: AAA family ATPase [Gammaproteobacteria bacterium]|nr:AAA family ATPase [Gammaproteobacteria bacterium]MCP5135819.1 AAA family ATPase [Gammaproteobacteria bacterium]
MRESDTASRFIQGDAAHSVTLTALAGRPAIQHLFQPEHIDAINFAIACGRPVLLTGETGVGKTQLARAAAKALKRAYVRYTVDARSESRDLLWKFDAVARLADAQIASALGASKQAIQSALAAGDYLVPGPLWWGFDWAGAEALGRAERPHQADSGDPCNGVVVLIDEIDKGELEVPQGLLEALGDGGFQPEHRAMRVHATGTPPLVILTSNGEKALPDAFVRRCLVLNIELPTDEARLTGFLVERGAAHTSLKESIMRAAAKQLIADRNAAAEAGWLPLPGLAEYIDLLNVLEQSVPEDGDHLEVLDRASEYLFRKAKVLARG